MQVLRVKARAMECLLQGFIKLWLWQHLNVLHVKAETSVAEDDEMLSDRHASCQVMVTHGW